MVTAKNKNKEIGKWLQGLLENLTDDDNKQIFKKVLLGIDEQQIKTFGDGVLATTYVTGADYQDTFGIHNRPVYIKSHIAFIIKGTSEAKYNKGVQIYCFCYHICILQCGSRIFDFLVLNCVFHVL